MPDTLVHGNYAFSIKDLEGAEELKCFAITLPAGSIEIGVVKHFGEKNGTPVPLSGGGHQTSWNPVEIQRYKDGSTALIDWFMKVKQEGATESTKQSPTITCYSGESPLFAWKLTNAVITSYSQSPANAQTHDLMTEQATLTYEEAEQLPG